MCKKVEINLQQRHHQNRKGLTTCVCAVSEWVQIMSEWLNIQLLAFRLHQLKDIGFKSLDA